MGHPPILPHRRRSPALRRPGRPGALCAASRPAPTTREPARRTGRAVDAGSRAALGPGGPACPRASMAGMVADGGGGTGVAPLDPGRAEAGVSAAPGCVVRAAARRRQRTRLVDGDHRRSAAAVAAARVAVVRSARPGAPWSRSLARRRRDTGRGPGDPRRRAPRAFRCAPASSRAEVPSTSSSARFPPARPWRWTCASAPIASMARPERFGGVALAEGWYGEARGTGGFAYLPSGPTAEAVTGSGALQRRDLGGGWWACAESPAARTHLGTATGGGGRRCRAAR